jgi:putative phage-type endonuclease
MKEIEIEQGTQEWLDLRRNLRMASETPAILGVSPYQSHHDVRAAKRGRTAFQNAAMRQGTEQEPIARAAYEEAFEMMRPAMFVDGDYGCSLDGISLDGSLIVEIKTPFKGRESDRWQAALEGRTTEYDFAQIQHQLMVCQAKLAHLWVWDTQTQEGNLVEVRPEPAYWETIRTAWDAFWPTLAERDDEAWSAAALEYKLAKEAADKAIERLETVKKDLIEMTVGDFNFGYGVQVKKVSRAGSIDWKAVEKKHLAGVDLEGFRKKAISFYTVEEAKL